MTEISNRIRDFLRRIRGERGQDLVEYALIAPILMLLTIGIIEFSVILLSYNTIANAAREGARAGIVPNVTDAEIVAAAQQLTIGLDQSELTIATPIHGSGTVQVQISYNVRLITGSFVEAIGGSSTLALNSTATMQTE